MKLPIIFVAVVWTFIAWGLWTALHAETGPSDASLTYCAHRYAARRFDAATEDAKARLVRVCAEAEDRRK
jgi:hypothetical protein